MLSLVEFGVCKETIAVLLHLLSLAMKGKLRGIAICYWLANGARTQVALTGIYRAEPERALGGADLIKAMAGRQLDLFM